MASSLFSFKAQVGGGGGDGSAGAGDDSLQPSGSLRDPKKVDFLSLMKQKKEYQERAAQAASKKKKAQVSYVDYKTITFTNDQKRAFDALCSTSNVLITGPAGTGKSTLLKSYYCWYIDKYCFGNMDDESIYITSTTGISSMNISGITIHSWSGIEDGSKGIDYYVEKIKTNVTKRAAYNRWKKAKVLIIDEISMMSGELLDKLSILGQRLRGKPGEPFGGIQVILFCDFLQLPPVKSDLFCFDAICWRSLRLKVVHLNEIVRQKDREFQVVLNKIRIGFVDDHVEEYLMAIYKKGRPANEDGIIPTVLFPLKKQVNHHNQMELMKLEGESHTFSASYSFSKSVQEYERERFQHLIDEGTNCEASLHLAVGAQVMYLVNDMEKGLVNGSRGIVTGFVTVDGVGEGGTPTRDVVPVVKFLNHEKPMIVEYDVWTHEEKDGKAVSKKQMPLILAWALTVHKTQGCTLEYCELNIGKDIFEAGQTYVALSRVKDPSGLFISALDVSKIRANERCIDFYLKLYNKSADLEDRECIICFEHGEGEEGEKPFTQCKSCKYYLHEGCWGEYYKRKKENKCCYCTREFF